MAELPAASSTPGVKPSLIREGYRVGITARDLYDFDSLEQLDQPRSRLVRISFHVCGQILHRLQSKLTARTGTPRVHIAIGIDCHCMPVSTGDLVDAFVPQLSDFQWVGLERVPLTVLRHLGDDLVGVAKLSHLARAPSVEVPLLIVVDLVLLQEKLVLVLQQSLV